MSLLKRSPTPSLLAAGASFALLAVVGFTVLTPQDLMSGYLDAFFFFVQLSIGALGLLCIHNLTGGRWGYLVRPFLRWTTPTFLVLTLLSLPLYFFASSLYPWANPNLITHDPLILKRLKLMNVPFFAARSLFYLVLWSGFAFWTERRSRLYEQDRVKHPARALSGGVLLLILFSFSLAAMDWVMTVDREWSATGFGALALTGALSNGVAFIIMMSVTRERRLVLQGPPGQPLLGDLGNLLLMSVMMWAYLDFTQYLISWSGQLPREMRWYNARTSGLWLVMVNVIFISHFVIPFSAMLFRGVKRSPNGMLVLAGLVLFAQALENVVWTAPSLGLALPRACLAMILVLLPMGFLWKAIVEARGQKEPEDTFRMMARGLSQGVKT